MELVTTTVWTALLLAAANTLSADRGGRPIVPAALMAPVLQAQDAPGGATPRPRGATGWPAVRPIAGPPPPVAPDTLARDTAGRATVRAVLLTEPAGWSAG